MCSSCNIPKQHDSKVQIRCSLIHTIYTRPITGSQYEWQKKEEVKDLSTSPITVFFNHSFLLNNSPSKQWNTLLCDVRKSFCGTAFIFVSVWHIWSLYDTEHGRQQCGEIQRGKTNTFFCLEQRTSCLSSSFHLVTYNFFVYWVEITDIQCRNNSSKAL